MQTLFYMRKNLHVKTLNLFGVFFVQKLSEAGDKWLHSFIGYMDMELVFITGPNKQPERYGDLLRRWFLDSASPEGGLVKYFADRFI